MKVLDRRCVGWSTVALTALLAVAAPLHAQSGEISGRVVTEAGEPVRGAQVRVQGNGITVGGVTDPAGRYAVAVPGTGTYLVSARSLGYRPVEREIALADAGAATLDLTLGADPVALSGVVVSATRSSTPVQAIPGAVTVVGREEIEAQARISPTLAGILSQTVPGLSAGTQSMSIYGQSLRGRNVAVLIDGVPQSTSRNVMRDFSTIDPSAIERVEVIRGATSVYGDGATGGVINIITRAGTAGPMRFSTEVGAEASLTHPGGSIGPRLVQSVSGRSGTIDYALTGSLSRTAGFYDAEGDLIPSDPHGQGGVADMSTWNVLGKLGTDVGAHRFQVTLNRFVSEQDTEFTTDPSVNGFEAGTRKARALRGLELAENQEAENFVGSLEYRTADLLGSEVRGQLFHRDYTTRFSPYDGRRWIGVIMQSYVDSRKSGGRLEVETPLPSRALPSLVWGADYTDEETLQAVSTMDEALYDRSGGLRFLKTGERVFVPPIHSRSLGLFAQAAATLLPGWEVRGGVRHERARLAVDDFTTITGNPVTGGAVDFTPTLFNLGTVVSLTSAIGVYGNYSEGFSLADVGRALRTAPAGTSIGDRTSRPQEVEQVEVGARGLWPRLQTSVAAFRNESDLGTSFDPARDMVRAPERIYGVEATVDAQPAGAVSTGGTFTWNEGESDVDEDGTWTALGGDRVQPMKITGYAEHRTLPGWTNRLQVLYSGSRDRAFRENPDGWASRPIESYWAVDYLGALELGPGTLTAGVHNLLNRQYFPAVSQFSLYVGNSSYAAGRGRTLSVGYSVSY